MKHITLILSILFVVKAYAQNCDSESLSRKTGTWKESSGSISGIPAAELARQKSTIATLHSMIKSKYIPTGVNVHCNSGYGRPVMQAPVNMYTYSIKPLNFICDGGVVKTVHESPTYFHIGINFLDAEIYDTAQGGRLLAEGFNVLPQMPVEKDGYYYFEEKDVSIGFGMTGKSRGWLITYNGKLPYAYVTKKEFLVKRKQILANLLQEEVSHIKDVLKNIEIEKGFKEKEFKNDADKLQRYMKMAYEPTKERYGKQLSQVEKKYEPAFDKIEAMLQSPAAELNEQAIVKNDPHDHLSYLFTTADDPMAKILIKPNPAYFNKKLPRSAPQFFMVYIRGNHKDAVAAEVMNGLENAVDLSALKKMLGK